MSLPESKGQRTVKTLVGIDLRGPFRHPSRLACPFFMAQINTESCGVAMDSCMKSDAYGQNFRYQEGLMCRSSFQAKPDFSWACGRHDERHGAARAYDGLPGRSRPKQARWIAFLRCRELPRQKMAAGEVRIHAKGDPGNRVTVTALCESALSLAQDDGEYR